MNLGQIIQSHALSFFHLSGPGSAAGLGQRPGHAQRLRPDRGRAGAGPRRHPAAAVRPGNHRGAGRQEDPSRLVRPRRRARRLCRENGATTCTAGCPRRRRRRWRPSARFKRLLDGSSEESANFGNFPSLFLGLVGRRRRLGALRRPAPLRGRRRQDRRRRHRRRPLRASYIGEAVEPDSYLKSPYYRPLGYPDGIYRVGPLARLNVCDRIGTPLADAELGEYRQRGGRTVNCLVLLPLRPADRDPGGDRAHRATAGRPGPALDAPARQGRHQPAGGRRRQRGAARHAVPPLPGGRERPADEGQPAHRHGAEQPGDEPHGGADRPTLHPRADRSRRAC